jgi:hypothetical protein
VRWHGIHTFSALARATAQSSTGMSGSARIGLSNDALATSKRYAVSSGVKTAALKEQTLRAVEMTIRCAYGICEGRRELAVPGLVAVQGAAAPERKMTCHSGSSTSITRQSRRLHGTHMCRVSWRPAAGRKINTSGSGMPQMVRCSTRQTQGAR